jgi:MFS family permease
VPSARTLFGEDADVLSDTNFRLLLLANIMGPLGPALVSPMLDTLSGPFGVSETAVGLMISAFIAPGIVLIPLAGVLADRYGRRVVLVAGLVLFGVGGTAIAFTTDFRVVLALRVMQGVGAAGMVPVIIASIGDIYRGTTEATAQGLRFTSSGLSQTVFPALAGVLVVIAWQYPLFIYGLSLPIAALVALRFDEPAPDRDREAGDTIRRLARFVARPHVLAMLVVFVTPPFLYIGFLTYVSVLVRLSGGTPGQAGLVVAVNSGVYAAAASQAGRITARFDSRLVPLVGTNAAMGLGLAVVALTPSVVVAGVGSGLLGIGFGITLSLYRSIATGLAPDDLRGGLVSLAESVIRVGATAAPVVMGAAIAAAKPEFGFATATRWTVLGTGLVASGVGIAGLLVMDATYPAPDPDPDAGA